MGREMIFKNRKEAGERLAQKLLHYKNSPNAIVLGLARGGIAVACEIAKKLNLPLNVLVPRKIGSPDNPELGIGAIAEDGEIWLNESFIRSLEILDSWIEDAAQKARKLADERLAKYRKIAPLDLLEDKIILLIDDGVATGATMLVEIQSLRKKRVRQIIAISPVAAADAWIAIEKASDQAICLNITDHFLSVSQFYMDFPQVEDEEVLLLLQKNRE